MMQEIALLGAARRNGARNGSGQLAEHDADEDADAAPEDELHAGASREGAER
jgi:hypothetical protein